MNHDFGLKQLLAAFVACVIGYLMVFYGIEHMRNQRGPWEVAFLSNPSVRAIVIDQPKLHIRNVRIIFPASSYPSDPTDDTNIDFGQARPVPFNVPFGQCVGLDTITMPGSVDLKLDGHDIQLLPRVLTIDGQEVNWRSGATISLTAAK